MVDFSDKNWFIKIGEKFGLLFDEEWFEVFEFFNEKFWFLEEECCEFCLKYLGYVLVIFFFDKIIIYIKFLVIKSFEIVEKIIRFL